MLLKKINFMILIICLGVSVQPAFAKVQHVKTHHKVQIKTHKKTQKKLKTLRTQKTTKTQSKQKTKKSQSKQSTESSYQSASHVNKSSSKSSPRILTGIASWYGPGFQNKRTASGERYNMYQLTAAHKTLPLSTYVEVTNLKNGKNVVVKINDRGPFIPHRTIDLSYAAAKKIGMVSRGIAPVSIKIVKQF